VRCEGKVIGYRPHPSLVIETDEGKKEHWNAHMCEVLEEATQTAGRREEQGMSEAGKTAVVPIVERVWFGGSRPTYTDLLRGLKLPEEEEEG
jgi:hypothetical protein